MSRSSILPSFRASRQTRMASNVNGLSRMAPSIISRPASMRFAIATSPSRDRSWTDLISRRYIRVGSSVRPISSSRLPRALAGSPSGATGSSPSSLSVTVIPSSDSIVIVSSISSEDS